MKPFKSSFRKKIENLFRDPEFFYPHTLKIVNYRRDERFFLSNQVFHKLAQDMGSTHLQMPPSSPFNGRFAVYKRLSPSSPFNGRFTVYKRFVLTDGSSVAMNASF